jgi:hypothetical protein
LKGRQGVKVGWIKKVDIGLMGQDESAKGQEEGLSTGKGTKMRTKKKPRTSPSVMGLKKIWIFD